MLAVLLFNIVEIITTVFFGILIGVDYTHIAIILIVWIISRSLVEKPMHYKNPIKCFIMTLTLFVSLFLTVKIHLLLGVVCVIFDSFVLSNHGNVEEIMTKINQNVFQWNNFGNKRKSNYQKLIDYIKDNQDCKIIGRYEDFWKENYPDRQNVFDLFFRKRMTYEEIVRYLNLKDHTKIKNECKIIYATLEVPLSLKKPEVEI